MLPSKCCYLDREMRLRMPICYLAFSEIAHNTCYLGCLLLLKNIRYHSLFFKITLKKYDIIVYSVK